MEKRERKLVRTTMIDDLPAGLEFPDQYQHSANPMEYQWVQAAKAGDLEAYNHLVRLYQAPLFHWVYHLVDDPALAEDITQASFLAAYQKLYTFHGGSLKAWLFKIARNRAYDILRRQRRHPLSSLDEHLGSEDDRELHDLIPTEELSPEDAAVLSEQADRVYQVLSQIPTGFQSVLMLVDLNALEYQEAAGILNIPIGTLKSRLARARQKFRETAARHGLFFDDPE